MGEDSKAEGLTRAFENKGERFLAVRDVSFSPLPGRGTWNCGRIGLWKKYTGADAHRASCADQRENRVFEQRSYPCGEQRMEEVLSGNAAGVSASEGVLRFRKNAGKRNWGELKKFRDEEKGSPGKSGGASLYLWPDTGFCRALSRGGERRRMSAGGHREGTAVEPSLLICDEATSALDVTVQETDPGASAPPEK